jgi:hypothetical protein
MNRQEAAAVLREVLEACQDLVDMNYVSLNPSDAKIRKKTDNYELYIKCVLDNSLKRCLTPILEKHQLRMKELSGAISIYTPE